MTASLNRSTRARSPSRVRPRARSGASSTNRAALGTLAVFVVMMAIFMVASPSVFLRWPIYIRFSSLCRSRSAWSCRWYLSSLSARSIFRFRDDGIFGLDLRALSCTRARVPFLGYFRGACDRHGARLVCVGALVVTAGLSSLIATLGMNYMLRGFIMIVTQGKSIALLELQDTTAGTLFSSRDLWFSRQVFWALAFVVFAGLLFNRHRFVARVRAVGDNPDSATQMGINVARVRISTFVFMGLGAALAGVLSTMVNFTWWPTTGDGYLLPAIASVFVGGTPTWGGVGTVTGGAIGALTVSFIQSGIVAAGLSGFYVQFFNGLIIILALLAIAGTRSGIDRRVPPVAGGARDGNPGISAFQWAQGTLPHGSPSGARSTNFRAVRIEQLAVGRGSSHWPDQASTPCLRAGRWLF